MAQPGSDLVGAVNADFLQVRSASEPFSYGRRRSDIGHDAAASHEPVRLTTRFK
jgi:hypothetical protein